MSSTDPNPTSPARPSYEELLALVGALRQQLAQAHARIEQLEAKVAELQRGQQRPHAPFSKGPPKTHPQKPGRKPGENYGLKKHREPPPHIDQTIEAPVPDACPVCGGQLNVAAWAEQFQEEIVTRTIRRRIRIPVCRCRQCRLRVQGRHPVQTSDALGAASSQIGPDAQALAVELNKIYGLSYGKIASLLRRYHGLTITRGGLTQAVLRAGRKLQPQYDAALARLRQAAAVYPDETGWKVGGLLHWLWAFVCDEVTVYAIDAGRGFDQAAAVLGADYAGTLVHDGWRPYEQFVAAEHQTCLAHLLRRCRQLLEIARAGACRFPRAVQTLLQRGLALRQRREQGTISERGLAVATGKLEAQLTRRVLFTNFSHAANRRLAKHLLNNLGTIYTFLRAPGVEATNWPAEQAIRPAVVNRKVWGGSRTAAGARAQSILMTVLETLRKQGRDAVDFISSTLRTPATLAPPQLLPA